VGCFATLALWLAPSEVIIIHVFGLRWGQKLAFPGTHQAGGTTLTMLALVPKVWKEPCEAKGDSDFSCGPPVRDFSFFHTQMY